MPGQKPAWNTRGGEEFSERDPNLLAVSNSFKLYPTHFSRGKEIFNGGFVPPIYGSDAC